MPKIKQAEFRLEPRFYSKNFLNKAKITLEKMGFSLISGPNTSIGAVPLIQPGIPNSTPINPINNNSVNNTRTGPNIGPNLAGGQNITPLLAPGVNAVGANFQNRPLQAPQDAPTGTEFDENVRRFAMGLKGGDPALRQQNSAFQFMSAPGAPSSPSVKMQNGRLTYKAPQFPTRLGDDAQDAYGKAVEWGPYYLRHHFRQLYPNLPRVDHHGNLTEHGRWLKIIEDTMDSDILSDHEKVSRLIGVAAQGRNSPLGKFALRLALTIVGDMSEERAQILAQQMLNNGMTEEQVQQFFQAAHDWVKSIYSSIESNSNRFFNRTAAIDSIVFQSLVPEFRGGLSSIMLSQKIPEYIGADQKILDNVNLDLLARTIGVRNFGRGDEQPQRDSGQAEGSDNRQGNGGQPEENNNRPEGGGQPEENNNRLEGGGQPNARVAPNAPAGQAAGWAADDAEWAWRRFNESYRQTPSYMPFSQYHQQIHRGIGDVLRSNNMPAHQKAWWLLTYGNMAYATRNPALAQFAYQTGMYFVGKLNNNEANQFKNMLKMQGFNDNQINMFLQQAKAFAALMDDRAERRAKEEHGLEDNSYPLYYGVDWDWFNRFNRANNRNKGRR